MTDTDTTAAEAPKKKRRPPRPVVYGEREIHALYMVSRGIKYGQIATELEISVDTVKGHLKRVYRKLGAKSGAHAVAIAIGRGMIDPEPPVMSVPAVDK